MPIGEPSAGAALVSAASGIGDILRITPLVRVFHYLGFGVDVVLSPDDPAAADLLRGAKEIDRLIVRSRGRPDGDCCEIESVGGQPYDVATFTHWSAPLARRVKARQKYTFSISWRREGDVPSVDADSSLGKLTPREFTQPCKTDSPSQPIASRPLMFR